MQSLNSIGLKKIEIGDYKDYYEIRSEQNNLFWTGYEKKPDYDQFKEHFKNRIKDPLKDIYILRIEKECVGALNIDYENDHAAIGYSIKSMYTQQGYASLVVKMAKVIVKNVQKSKGNIKAIVAWINEKNHASIRVIEKNGYHIVESEYRERLGNQEKYLLYKLNL